MKLLVRGLLLVTIAAAASPIGKVIQLLNDLDTKIQREGEAEQKSYEEYVEWCKVAGADKANDIKTNQDAKARHEAEISKLSADADVARGNIDTLAANLAEADSDLTAAIEVRNKERSEFAAAEKELVETSDALSRAIKILNRELSKNPGAFAQVDLSSFDQVVKGLGAIVDAASLTVADRTKLLAFAQSQQSSEDEDLGEPSAAVYKSKSGSIVEVLEDLRDKAQEQLSKARDAESKGSHNFNLLKQSLEDQMGADNKDMDETKSLKASLTGDQATSEKDLARTEKSLKSAIESLDVIKNNCATVADDHARSVSSRSEERAAIGQAIKILNDTTSGAAAQSYGLLQKSTLHTHADLRNLEVVSVVKKLAKEQHSEALAQLATRVAALIRYGARSGDDVFAKVKGLIQDMIAKLEKEANADATEKAYCDEQTAKTKAKLEDLTNQVEKLKASIDTKTARSTRLKGDVKTLQKELADLAASQAEMDKLRSDQNAEYRQAKSDLELGLGGVRSALKALRDYYGQASFEQQTEPSMPEVHTAASGAGGSIVGILEVVESDFAKNLAAEEAAESDASEEHDKTSQENAITKAEKEQDVKYKEQDANHLDKEVAELKSDLDTESTELAAVHDYQAQINKRCIAKPETYAARAGRREAEIAGLKEALGILEGETALLQNKKRAKFLSHRLM